MEEIKKDVKKILTNHLPHICEDMKSVKTNQDWLMKFFWIVATASLGSLLASLFNIVGGS